ncbi:MAG: hypothetical protein Q7V58_06865 [Actinomycetota bacterium]|nr:hypothetical protein [Actinomycetota bacterium]
MTPHEGMVVAVATDEYEIHVAEDGSCAWTVYPWWLCALDEARFFHMMAIIFGMGFDDPWCGSIEVADDNLGLTGSLAWDEWQAVPLPE